jgi:hypothetical protein
LGAGLGEISQQAHQKEQQWEQCKEEIIRELSSAAEYVVVVNACPKPPEKSFPVQSSNPFVDSW